MMNSKKKGNVWELFIANLFTEHFGQVFKRVPSSGALVGGKNRKLTEGLRSDAVEILGGDIISPINFPFSIEAKCYKDFEFHQALQGSNKTLDGWIEQAEGDAKVSGKEFLLVMKFNRKGQFVCTNDLEVGRYKLSDALKNFIRYKDTYLIYTLEEFLELSFMLTPIIEWEKI